jgi:hypothetical protein
LSAILWLFWGGLACASLPRDSLSRFTCDALNQLVNVTRSATLTVSGSFTGAVATLGVNGKVAQIYSDSTFATGEGLSDRSAERQRLSQDPARGGRSPSPGWVFKQPLPDFGCGKRFPARANRHAQPHRQD